MVELKVKIKSLAAEAAIIRKEERKALQSGRWANANRQNDDEHFNLFDRLRRHRVGRVRSAARSAQLAYAFLSGRPYRTVEKVGSREPSWKNVERVIHAFAPLADPVAFENWRRE